MSFPVSSLYGAGLDGVDLVPVRPPRLLCVALQEKQAGCLAKALQQAVGHLGKVPLLLELEHQGGGDQVRSLSR